MFSVKRKSSYEILLGEGTHKNGYALSNGPGPASEKPPELTGRLTWATSADRPLPFPGGESSIPCVKYDEIQARRAGTMNEALPDRESSAFADGSFSPISLGSQYQTSPERWKGVVNMEESVQRGVNETARPGILGLRQPDPALVEAQMPTTPERDRRGVNTSEANFSLPSSTTPKYTTDGEGAEGASLEQNLASLLARLQNNKDFDALISGNVKASSIPQSTSCSSSVASQTTNCGDTSKKDDIAVQADKAWKNLHERNNFATPSPDEETVGNTSKAPPAPEVEVVPVDDGEKALSVNLPRISFREQDALRLLYRRWWMRLARGDSISCLPTPTVGRDKQMELANENCGEKENANLGPKALARVKLRKTSTLDSSTARDDVAFGTEIELPGSLVDFTTTLFASLGVRQTLVGKITDEQRSSGVSEKLNNPSVQRRPQLEDDCTDDTISMTLMSSSASTCIASEDAGKITSNCRTRAINISPVANLARDEQITSLRRTESRAESFNSAEGLAQNDLLGYTGNQSNQPTTDSLRRRGEGQTVPLRTKDVPTVPTLKDFDVETETETPESFGDATGTSPSSNAQRISMGAEMDKRRRSGTEIATSLTLASPPIITRGADHKGHHPIPGRMSARSQVVLQYFQDPPPVPTLKDVAVEAKELSTGSLDGDAKTHSSPGIQMTSVGVGTDEKRSSSNGVATSMTMVSSPIVTRKYVRDQHNQASFDSRRLEGEEQVVLQYFQDSPSVPTLKDVAVEAKELSTGSLGDDAKAPSSPGVQLTSVGVETDEKRPSSNGVATSMTMVSSPIVTRDATHEARDAIRDRTRTTSVSLDLRMDLARDEQTVHDFIRARATSLDSETGSVKDMPSRYTRRQSNEPTTGTIHERGEEENIPPLIQDDPTPPTRKDIAIETEVEPPGRLGDDVKGPWASPGVQLISVGIGTDEITSCARTTRRSSDSGQRDHRAVEGTKFAISVAPTFSPFTSFGATDDVGHTTSSQTKIGASHPCSTLGFVQEEPPDSREVGDEMSITNGGGGETGAMTSANPSVPATETYGATDDACHTCYGRTREITFRSGSTADLARDKLSESMGNPLNQTLNNSRRGTEAQQIEPRHSTHVTTVSTRKDGAAATEIQLPWNLSLIPSFFRGERLTSAVPATDKRPSIGATSTENSDAVHFPQGGDMETKAITFVTPLMPSNSTYGTVDAAGRISQSQTRIEAFHPGSAAGLAREEFPGYTGNGANQISSIVTQGKGKQQVGPQYSQDASETPMRKENAVATEIQLPWNLSLIPSVFRGERLTSAVPATDKIPGIGVASTENSDAVHSLQGGNMETKATTFVTPLTPSNSTYGAMDATGRISQSQTRVGAFYPGSAAGLAREELPGYTGNETNQISSFVTQRKGKKQVGPQYSQDASEAPMRKGVAVATEIQLPWNFSDVSAIPAAFHGVNLESVEATNQKRSSGANATAGPDAAQRPRGGDGDTQVRTSANPLTTPADTYGTKGNSCYTSRHQTKVITFRPGTTASSAGNEYSESTCNQFHQALNARRLPEFKQAESRYSRNDTTIPARKDVAVATEIQLTWNISPNSSVCRGVQLTSAMAAKDERRSIGFRATRNSDAVQFKGGDMETKAATSVTLLTPFTSICGAGDDAGNNNQGRTRVRATHPHSIASLVQGESPDYTCDRPNQVSNETRRAKEEEQAGPRHFQSATRAPTQKGSAIATERQLPSNLVDVSSIPSASLGVTPSSVKATVEKRSSEVIATGSSCADQRFRGGDRDTEDANSTAPLVLRTGTYATIDNSHHTCQGRTRQSDFYLGSVVASARDELSGSVSYPPSQALRNAKGGKEKRQAERRYSQGATAVLRRNCGAAMTKAHIPWHIFGISAIPSTSRKVQLFSEGVRTDGGRSSAVSATRSSDAIRCPQITGGSADDAISTASSSLASATCGTRDDAGHISSGEMRAKTSPSDSAVGLAQDEPSRYTGNQPVSAGPGTGEIQSSGSKSGEVSDAIQRLKAGGMNTKVSTSVVHIALPTATCGATDDAGHINCGQTRVSSYSSSSQTVLTRNEPSGCTGNQPDQALRNTRRGTEDGQAGPRCSRDVTTFPTRGGCAVRIENQFPRSLPDGLDALSSLQGVQLISGGEGTDQGRRYDERMIKGSDSTRRQDTGEIPEAATFSAFLSARSGTYGTAGDAGYINHGQRRIGAFHPVSKASFVRDEPSENQGNQANQIPRDTRRGIKEGQAGQQYSQDATTVTTQRGGMFATENQLPRDCFDVSVILSPDRRVQLTSIGIRPDEGRGSIAGATRSSSNTDQHSQGTDGDTKVVEIVSPISQPTCTCSATDTGNHNNHGRARTSAFRPGSVALVRDEPLENTRKQLNYTSDSGDARRGEEGDCKVRQCSQCFFTAPTQNDVAAGAEVHLPERNVDIMGSLFTSPEIQRTSGEKERRRSGARAIKNSFDAGWSPQNTNGGTGAVSSTTPMLPPASTIGVLDDAGHKRRDRTRARFASHDSEANLATKELSGYESNQPNQVSCNAKPKKREGQAVSGCSQDFARACTRNKDDVATKPESPENLREITGSAFDFPGAQLTSGGVGPDGLRCRDARTTRRSLEVGRRPQDAGGGPEHTTSATSMTLPICTCGATDGGHTEQGQTKINYVRRGSNTYLELKEPSGYTDNPSNQASSGTINRRGKSEKPTLPICSQDYATVRTRMDVAVSATVESPGSSRHLKGDISSVSRVRLTSEGVESDGRRQNSARATKRFLDVNQSPQGAKNDTDATTSVTSMSPPTCTCGATNRDRMRVKTLSHCLETDLGRKEPSGSAGHPFNQASKYDRRGRDEEHEVTRYSHDIANTCTRNNDTVATKAESSESPSDITGSPCASSRLHPTLARVATDKICRGGARATRSCPEVGHSAHAASGDTEATMYSTPMSPPECTCCAVDDASHTSRGRTKVSISRLDSEEDSTQEEPLGYAANSCYQTLRDARRGQVGNFEGMQSSQDSTTSRTRKNVAVELPRSLGNSMESPYSSPGPQLDENRRNGGRATRSNSDAGQFSQGSREYTEAAMSAISTSPPICACGATKAGQSNRGRTRVNSRDSAAYLAREGSSGYASNPSYQASRDARRRKEGKHNVTQNSQYFTPARSPNKVAGTSKAGSQGSLCDITRISFNSPRLQLTSTGVGTDERRRSGAKTKRSSSEVGRRPQGVNESFTVATSVTPKSSLKCACCVTDDADHTSCGRARVNSTSRRSETDLAWREHSGNTSILSCQTSSDAIIGKKEQQSVSRRFRDAATARARKNSYVEANTESQRSLCGATGCTSASPGVQLASVEVGTTVRRRDGAKSKRSSSDVTRRPQGTSENTEAETAVTQVSMSTCTYHASDDAGHTSRSRTRLNSSSRGLRENYTRKDHSVNTGNPSNQTSRDVRRYSEDEHEVPPCFEDSIIAHTRKDVAAETKIESPGGFGEATWGICDSPGAHLTSAGGRMDERLCDRTQVTRRSLKAQRCHQDVIENTGAAKYVALISPPICTCGVTDDADHTSRDQSRENSLSSGSEANLARKDPWGYTDDRMSRVASDDKRGNEEEENLLQFSKNSTTARMRKTVTVASRTDSPVSLGDTTGSPSVFPEVRPSVEEGTNKRRGSGWETTKSSDVGLFPQRAGRGSEVATFVTSIQPSTCTCGATYDAGHNSRDRTRMTSLNRDSGPYSSLREPTRKKGIEFSRISTDTGRGEEDERRVQRGSRDLTQARR